MPSSVRLIRRYVWLIDTIRRAGRITLEDINRRWLANQSLRLEEEEEIPERTFHRHRQAIADIFGVDILCDRYDGNSYYIENPEALDEHTFTSTLFNGLAIDNQLMDNKSVSDRIIFEDSPGGSRFLSSIVEAISGGLCIRISYRRFNSPDTREHTVEPLLLKQSGRRWYLIARLHDAEEGFTVFALDRILSLAITDLQFAASDISEIKKAFDEVIGVNVDDDYDCEKITIRVFGRQRAYIDSLLIHPSQRRTGVAKGWSDYEFFLRPEYEFQREILRLGPDAEVLSPSWLRDELKWLAAETANRYPDI